MRRRRCAAMTSEPYSDERSRVAQVVDVLARGALVRRDAPSDRLGTSCVARHRLSRECLGEVRADDVEVDRLDLDDRVSALAVGLDDHERMSLEHRVADRRR